MSTGINIASSSGLTVGTTAVTSGTDGRVFFQAGGVVQQDANFTFDNTLKRLTLKAVGTAGTDIPFAVQNSGGTANHFTVYGNDNVGIGRNSSANAVLFIRSAINAAHDVLTLQNSFYGDHLFRIRDHNNGQQSSTCSIFIGGRIYGGNSVTQRQFDIGTYGLGSIYGEHPTNTVLLNNEGNVGDTQGSTVIAVTSNVYINNQTTKKYKFETVTGNFGIGNVGSLGARLDVRAQGALSTDIAFRVRNSVDTADIFSVRGNGEMYIPNVTNNSSNTIYFDSSKSIIKYTNDANGCIALGQNATFSNGTFYTISIGNNATTGALGGASIAIGNGTNSNGGYCIAIGENARTAGSHAINIGTGGATQYSGTNSIHLGKKGNLGNNFTIDNVFITYFNSDYGTTVTKSNGSLGLIGQQEFFHVNGSGLYGIDNVMGNGGNTLVVKNHTAVPSTNITNAFQLYSNDITAGNAAPHFRTENGAIVKVYQETTAVGASTLVSGIGTPLTDTDTFDGYTLKQIVKALRNQGLLA